ncbi:MAG: delta-60 repeat domain-containing protein, partial [Planctomycetota bacterium]
MKLLIAFSLLFALVFFSIGCTKEDDDPPPPPPPPGSGSLDPTFATIGYVVNNGAADGDDYGQGITVDSTGRILVAGAIHNGSDLDIGIWCLDANGTLDPAFGTGGVVVDHNAAGGNQDDIGYGIAL